MGWYIDISDRPSQVGCDGCRRLHLFQPVVEIHMVNAVTWLVVIRILIPTVISLDLQSGRYSLRTEGHLVPSAAADDERWRQVKLVSHDRVRHPLRQDHGWCVVGMP
jgi:hypothetical protein